MPGDGAKDGRAWPLRHRAALLVLGAVLAVVAAAVGGALVAQVLTNDYQVAENATYVAPDGLTVEVGENVTTDRQFPFPDSSTVDLGPSIEFSADGDAHVRFSGTGADWLILSNLSVASNQLRVRPENQTDVNVEGAATRLEVNSVALDDGEADLDVTSPGDSTIRVWDLPADTTVLAVDNQTGGAIEAIDTDAAGSGNLTVSQDREVRFTSQVEAPELSNPSPANGSTVGDYEVELSVDVDDPDFTETWGDNVTVVFHDLSDDSEIINQTVGSSGTVSGTWSGLNLGTNRWNVTAEDEYGNSDALGPFEVETPNELEIRDEQTQNLIDDASANVSVQFYPTSEDSDTIVSRETDDGTANLTGLPTDQNIVVDADAEGYHARSVIIRDVTVQRTAYLLDENATTVRPSFQVTDRTGDFPADDSRLIVRRPLENTSDTSVYRTIVGDVFGANELVTPTLEEGARYRIIVESPTGEQRSFGSYLAEDSEAVTLDIGEIDVAAPGESGYVFDAGELEDQDMLRVSFRDADEATTELTYSIYEQHNASNVIFGPETVQNPTEYQETIPIPENHTDVSRWVVDYEITRNGETIDNDHIVGGLAQLNLPVSSTLLQTVGLFGLLLLAGLFGGRLSRTGALVVSAIAIVLWMVGIVTIPWPALFAAGAISLLFKLGEGTRGVAPI